MHKLSEVSGGIIGVLVLRDDAIGLIADIHNNLILLNSDHGALDNGAGMDLVQ